MNVPAIKIGDFNVLATIEYGAKTLDPNWNTELVTWHPLMTDPGSPTVARRVWAKLEDQRPSREERVQSDAEIHRHGTYMWIRWLPIPVDASMRVTLHRAWGDEVRQVVGGPSVIGNNEYLEFKLEKFSS